jgi:hypothetical protein
VQERCISRHGKQNTLNYFPTQKAAEKLLLLLLQLFPPTPVAAKPTTNLLGEKRIKNKK